MKDQLLDLLLILAAALFLAGVLSWFWFTGEGRYVADTRVTIAVAPGAEAVPYREEP